MTNNEAPTAPLEPTPNPGPATPVKKRGASRIITPILALVAALVIGLFGGVLIGHSTASANTSARGGFRAGGFGTGQEGAGGTGGAAGGGAGAGARGGFAGGGFTAGKIVSISGNTITVKETDGTTVKVTTSGSTTVSKTIKSSVSDLATGESITVVGAKDSSGNVTATVISEGASGFGGFRGGAGGGAGGTGGGTNG